MSDQIDTSWQVNADAWTRAVRERSIESRRVGTDAAILDAVCGERPTRALDAGCGEGWLTRALSAAGIDALGIDGSPALIERARELHDGRYEVLSYKELVRSPESVPGPFDAIVCNFSLFDKDLAPVLRALAARLTPAGHVFIQTPHPLTVTCDTAYHDSWRTETFDAFGEPFPQPMQWYFRTIGSWLRELRAAGLRVASCAEPLHPVTGKPLSLLLVCERQGR